MPLRPSQLTRFALRSLVYHETVPGHHFQIALAWRTTSFPLSPKFVRSAAFPPVSEGWALYAERFAAEDGWYEGELTGSSAN